MTALYLRVSTSDQCVEMQRDDLLLACAARRWDDIKEYEDKISGMKRERPALDRLLEDIRVGRVKRIVVWRFDRMARSTLHLLEILALCKDYNVDFVSLKESFDTSTPMGRAILTILGAISQLERETIRERVRAGIARAKKEGKPHGRPKVIYDRLLADEMRRNGCSMKTIADKLNVSTAVICRDLKVLR